jgi:hypothetical protein
VPLIQPAPAIRQGTPEVTLLTSARPLPPEVRDYDKWRAGLSHRSTQTIAADARAICVTGDKVARDETAAIPEFLPFDAYVVHGCDGFVDEAQYRREAVDALEDRLAWIIGRELWTSGESPSLQSVGQDIGGNGGVISVANYLIANMEEATKGGQVFLHVPSLAAGLLVRDGYVNRSGNRLLTGSGHVVVPGPGYPFSPGDWGPTASTPSASGQVWMYATGPVEVGVTEQAVVTDVGRGTAARMNLFEVYATKQAIVRFDIDYVFAAVADVPDS